MKVTLSLDRISFLYEQDYPLIADLSYSFEPGMSTAIVGTSGSGKTTLLHLIAGLIQPCKGSIILNSHDLHSLSNTLKNKLLTESFSFVFSTPFLIPELDVMSNIFLGQKVPDLNSDFFQNILEIFDLKNKLNSYPTTLSSGQQQRVSVLRGLMRPSSFVLADEPTAHLDKQRGVLLMKQFIDILKKQQRGLICVTHDPDLLPMFDCVLELKN